MSANDRKDWWDRELELVCDMRSRNQQSELAERSGVAQPCPPSANGCPEARADGRPGADSSVRCPEVNGFPELPRGITRAEAIEGLRELRDLAVSAEKQKDPCFVRWPDLDAILDYIDQHGFPAPENAGQCNGQRVLPDNSV